MKIYHYHVESPEASFSWIGGKAEPDGEHLWLTNPGGQPVLRVPRSQVTETTPEQTAARIIADREAAAAQGN